MSRLGALILGRANGNPRPATSSGGVSLTGPALAGTVGSAYSFTPTASGGTGTKIFSAIGALPPGLSLNTATGAVTGTPTAAGTSSFAVGVSNASGYAVLPVTLIVASGSGGNTASDFFLLAALAA